MQTLYLDPTSWDIVLDSNANIALASEPYSLAQDAASAIRTFSGEVFYNTKQGIPYFEKIFGIFPMPLALLKSLMVKEALTVPNVASAKVFFSSIANRNVIGQVQITSDDGAVAAVRISSLDQLNRNFILDQSTLG